MRRPDRFPSKRGFTVLLAIVSMLAGCAAQKASMSGSPSKETPARGMEAREKTEKKIEMPKSVEIALRLAPGQSWKSRFVSTSEVKWTLKGADGKEQSKSRAVGLEIVATQSVKSVSEGAARIEVDESSARILRDGKFVDAPFRQFGPPNPVAFTVNVRTGERDFSEMENSYEKWMAGVKEGPAGEILGKSFRLDSYVAQLKDLYGKPFARLAGKRLPMGSSATVEKDFVLPFLGPGLAVGPVPVEASAWYEGMEVRKETGGHYLKTAGKYSGVKELSDEELAGQLSEFGVAPPGEFRSSANIRGEFTASVDLMAGREVYGTSQLRYWTSASFGGGAAVMLEIAGKSILEPVE